MDKNRLESIVQKNSTSSKWLSVGGIILVVVGMVFYVFRNSQLKDENKVITDSLVTAHRLLTDSSKLIDSSRIFRVDSLKRDSIKILLRGYFSNKSKSDSVYRSYYADTLERFFLQQNISLNNILQNRLYISPKNTPRSKVLYNEDDVDIDLSLKDTIQVYASIRYYFDSLKPARNIVYQLRMNKNHKIFFVRNLLPQ